MGRWATLLALVVTLTLMGIDPVVRRQFSSSDKQRSLEFEVKPERLWSVDEIFDRADATLLVRLAEDRRIERKSVRIAPRDLGDYLAMWANTAPEGGLLVIGIDNTGAFEGCEQLTQEQLNRIEQAHRNYCPDVQPVVRRVPVTNQAGKPDFVLLIRVRYNPSIVVKTTAGKAYVRQGDSKYELSGEEIRELQADKGEIQFELRDCGLAYPQAFDVAAIEQFAAQILLKRGLSGHPSPEEVLVLRRLGRQRDDTFFPNLACCLLFARDPQLVIPGCKIRFQRFEGEREGTGEHYNAVKDLVLEGNVPSLIQQVEEVLDLQLRTFSPLDARGRFFPVPEYPKPAWYEAIVNACVHRSYGNGLRNMPIFVKLFEDRLVVESPGPFPPCVTPQNIYDMHLPRNPHLMEALFYLEYVKCAHEGTRRIRDSMKEMGLPEPNFGQSEVGHSVVRVTLRNNIRIRRVWIDKDLTQVVSEALAADLSANEKRVLNWVAERGSVTINDVVKLLGIAWQTSRKLLFGLARKRVLQYIRFREFGKDQRDPKAYFRVRSTDPLPEGAFEQSGLDALEADES